jgi:hypothetical protein
MDCAKCGVHEVASPMLSTHCCCCCCYCCCCHTNKQDFAPIAKERERWYDTAYTTENLKGYVRMYVYVCVCIAYMNYSCDCTQLALHYSASQAASASTASLGCSLHTVQSCCAALLRLIRTVSHSRCSSLSLTFNNHTVVVSTYTCLPLRYAMLCAYTQG